MLSNLLLVVQSFVHESKALEETALYHEARDLDEESTALVTVLREQFLIGAQTLLQEVSSGDELEDRLNAMETHVHDLASSKNLD